MRKTGLLTALIICSFFSLTSASLIAQGFSDKVKNEISEALNRFNAAAQNASTDQIMSLFDDSENIIFIGSDSGEIWRGSEQIRGHLNSIFPEEHVNLEMDRIDIDYNNNTAWVFVDGSINISNDKGEKFQAPYRFTAILVKKGSEWKWRMFSGSTPGGYSSQ
jgi:ketosteroid isomerase-like protein